MCPLAVAGLPCWSSSVTLVGASWLFADVGVLGVAACPVPRPLALASPHRLRRYVPRHSVGACCSMVVDRVVALAARGRQQCRWSRPCACSWLWACSVAAGRAVPLVVVGVDGAGHVRVR